MDLKTGSSNLSSQDVSLLNVQGEGSAVAVQDEAIEGLVPAVKNLIQSYPQLAGFFDPPVSQDDAIAILNSPHVAGLLSIETGATASAITLENIVRHVEFASVGGQFNTEVFESTLPQLKARSELGQESNPAQQKLVSTMADFAGQIASAQVTLDQAVQQLLVAVDDSPFLQSVLANEDPMSLHLGTPQKSQSLSQALAGLDLPIASSGPNGFSELDVSLESLSATFKSLMGSIAQFSSSSNNSINTGYVSQLPSNVANSVESSSTRSTDLPSNAPQLDAENKPTLPAQTRTEPVAAPQNSGPAEEATPASTSEPSIEAGQPNKQQQIAENIEKIQKLDLAFTYRTEELSNTEMREAKKLIKESIQMLRANSAAGNGSVLTTEQQTAFADSIVSLNSKVGGPNIAVRGSTTGEITVLVADPVSTAAETVIAKGKLKDFVPPDDVITSPNTESLAKLTTDKEYPVLSRTVPATAIEANTTVAGGNGVGTRSAELNGVDDVEESEYEEVEVSEYEEEEVEVEEVDGEGGDVDVVLDDEIYSSEAVLNQLKEWLVDEDSAYSVKDFLDTIKQIRDSNPDFQVDENFVKELLNKYYCNTTLSEKMNISPGEYYLFENLFINAGVPVPSEISDLVKLIRQKEGGEEIKNTDITAAFKRCHVYFEPINLSGFDIALKQNVNAPSSAQPEMLSDLFEMMGQFTHEQALLMTTEQRIQVANLAVEHDVCIPYYALLVLRGSSSYYDMPLDSFPRDIRDAINEKMNVGNELLISEIEQNDLLNKWAQGSVLNPLELKKVVTMLINISARAYGVSDPPKLMILENDGGGKSDPGYGAYDPETNIIEINPASDISDPVESLKLAELIFHEMSHAWQYQTVEDLTRVSESLDLSEANPENQLALLLKNSFDSVQDPNYEAERLPYYTGWEEKTSFFTGHETLIALLEYSNKHFETNYSWQFEPVVDGAQDVGVAPGFEKNSGGWELKVISNPIPTGLPGVRSALNSLINTDSPSQQQVTDLLNAVGELNHTQAALLGIDEKIQIINLARSAGVEIPQDVMSVLRGSASNFDQPLDSFPQDIQDLISGKSSEASASVAAAVQSDPLMARWFAGETLSTAELQQVTLTLGSIAADTFGLNPPPTVEFREFANASVEGLYDPATNSIQINPLVIEYDSTGALKLSQTIFHEMSAAWQHELVQQLPPAGQPLDMSSATPEEQLGLLLSASLNSQGSQQFEYLTGWEEKTSFSIGNSVFESVLDLSNEMHGSNFEFSHQPSETEAVSDSAEPLGYQQNAVAMVMGVTGSHGNAAASSNTVSDLSNPSAPNAPLPENEPGSTEVTASLPSVHSALNLLSNTDSPSQQQVIDLLSAVGELSHTQAAVLGAEDKIQIINLARSVGVEIPQDAMSVLRGSASNFDQPLDSFPQDIQDLISGKSSEASASVAAAVQSDPLMARWFAGETLSTAELQQVTATLGTIAADTYGLNPPPTVEFNEFADASVEGVYDPATNSIQINPSVIASDPSGALKLSQTIFHEMSHAWQHQLLEQLPPAGQPLDLATAKPEEQLGLLLSASLNSQGSQQFEYLTGWEEKTSFSIGNSVFQSVLDLSNEVHGSNFEFSYEPRRDETAPGSTERPGYEQTAGGMVMNVTGSHGNAGGSSDQPLGAVEDAVVNTGISESSWPDTEQINDDMALVNAKVLLQMNPNSTAPAFISNLSAVLNDGGAGTFAEVSSSMTDDQLALMFGTAVKAHPDLLAEMTTAIQSTELGPDVASKIVQHHRNTPDVLAVVDAIIPSLMFADWQSEGSAAYTNALMPDSSTNSSFANQPDSVKEVVLGRTYAKLTPEEASNYLMEHINTVGPVNTAGILSNMPTQQAASLYSHAANTNPELFEKMNTDLNSDSKYSGLAGVMNIYHDANTKLESHLLANMAEVDVYDDPATGQRAFVVRGDLVPRETTLAALASSDPLGTTEIYFGTLPPELSNLKKTNTLGDGNVADDSSPTSVKSLMADTELAKKAGTAADGSKHTLREEATIWLQAFEMNDAAPMPQQSATETETGTDKPGNMGLPDGADPDGNTGSIGAIDVSASGSANASSSSAQIGNGGIEYTMNAEKTRVLVAEGTAQKVNQNGDLVEGGWQVWAGVVQQTDGSFVVNENSGLVATFNANVVYGAQVSSSGQLDLNNLNVASGSGSVTAGVGTQAIGTVAVSKDLVQFEGSFDILFGASFDGHASVGGENTYLGVGAEAAVGAVGLGGGAEGSYENGVLHYEMNLGISLGLGIELSTSGGFDLIAFGNGARDYFTGDLELTNRKDDVLLNEGQTSVATGEGRDTAMVEQLFVLNPQQGYNEVKPLHYSFDGGRSVFGDHDKLRLPGQQSDWTVSEGENNSVTYTHKQYGTTVSTVNVEEVQYYGEVAGVDSQAVNDRAENSGKLSDQEYISTLTGYFEEKVQLANGSSDWEQQNTSGSQTGTFGSQADVETPAGYPSISQIQTIAFNSYEGDVNDTAAIAAHLEDFLANLKVTDKLDGKFYAALDHASVPERLPADWNSFVQIPVVANYFEAAGWDSLALAKLGSLYPAGGGNKQEFLQTMNDYFNAFGETIALQEGVGTSSSPTDIAYVESLLKS